MTCIHMYGEAEPRFAHETQALVDVAAHLHAQRVALYPAAIESGKLSEADAATGIRIMAAIVDDWRRKLTLAPPPAERGATMAEKIDTLERATARAAQLRDRMPPAERTDYAEGVATLLWWQQPLDFDPTAERGTTSRLDYHITLNLRIRAGRIASEAIAA